MPDFPINGQMFWGLAMALSSVVYVVVSLLTGRGKAFDMDKMLHRGAYLIQEEYTVVDAVPVKGWKVLGMGREFTRWDKVIYVATYAWTASWVVVFVVGHDPQPDPPGRGRVLDALLEDLHDDLPRRLDRRHRLVLGRRHHRPEEDDRDPQDHEARPRRHRLRRSGPRVRPGAEARRRAREETWSSDASPTTAGSSSSPTSGRRAPGSTTSRTGAISPRSPANGGGISYDRSPLHGRITRYRINDVPPDRPGKYIYVKDRDTGEVWSLTWQPVGREPAAAYRVAHGFGYTRAEAEVEGIASSVVFFVPADDDREIWKAVLTNRSGRARRLAVVGYVELALGHALVDLINQCDDQHFNRAHFEKGLDALFATKTYWVTETRGTQHQENKEWDRWAYFTVNRPVAAYETVRERFIGPFRSESNPIALERGLGSEDMDCGNAVAALEVDLEIGAGRVGRRHLLARGHRQAGVRADEGRGRGEIPGRGVGRRGARPRPGGVGPLLQPHPGRDA